jgi:glycosyltransferase involved in cell wall biosynthesis
MTKTAIIIPCYNEAKRLQLNDFLNFAEENKSVHFIFVNDGSTDNTLEKIVELNKTNPEQFLYVNLKENSGKAQAVRKGFLTAFTHNFDYIGFWDADLSTPLNTIVKFIHLISENKMQIVIGARVKLLGRNIIRKKSRHYLSRIFAIFAGILLRIPVYDTQCGAKLFQNTPVLRKVFSKRFIVKWTFDVELLARYIIIAKHSEISLNDKIIEYPLKNWISKRGSKVGYLAFIKAPFELAKIFAILYLPVFSHLYKLTLFAHNINQRNVI